MGEHREGELLAAVRCRQSKQQLRGYHQRAALGGICESHRRKAVSLAILPDYRGGRPLGQIPHPCRIQRSGIYCPLKSLFRSKRKASPLFLPFCTDAVKPDVFASP